MKPITVLEDLNHKACSYIKSYLSTHSKEEFEIAAFDVDKEIEKINPELWEAICTLTKSAAEKKGVSKMTELFCHTKKVRLFLIFCTMMFCINEDFTIPLHTLITDTIEAQGGSAMLIRILNQLGTCASSNTLAHYIQHKSSNRKNIMLQCLNMDGFSVVSIDNINFVHTQARISKGKNNSSWHGTSIQVVQPLPSLSNQRMSLN